MVKDAINVSSGNDVESKSNGYANGHTNGHANGKVNGSAKKAEPRIIDGWLEGGDPKIDADPHFDFGGTFGVIMMMIGFPTLMWYMWIGAAYYDGQFPTRASSDQSWIDFAKHLVHLAYTGAFPHRKAWAIYWVFGIAQSVFYYYLPGVYTKGKPLPHLDNKQLTYYCSGMWSFYVTIVGAIVLHLTGIFKIYTLIDEFGPLMSVAILSGFIVSVIAYFSTLARGQQHRMTGYPIYDFFMGAELNPRMFGWIDMKMFFEVRLPWFILFLVSLGGAARQYETYGYVTAEMSFLLMAHFLYANACCKGEEMIPVCWDVFYEKWGFMLIFWNMAGVPLSYCHCSIYLANHDPSEYSHSWIAIFLFFSTYIFMYWVWDTGNSQAKYFRAEERGYQVQRKAWPQLPWKKIDNPKKIVSDRGDALLCDGWYKMARKVRLWFPLPVILYNIF